MWVCKMIGHKYTPNLERIERESHGIGNESFSKETHVFIGKFCPRCADVTPDDKKEFKYG